VRQLKEWSTTHNWQARLTERIEAEADRVRVLMQERADEVRERLLVALEADMTRYIERLRDSDGEVMANSAVALEKLTKLYFQLAEQPLGDSREVERSGDINITVRDYDPERDRPEDPGR